jgi:hypothetical protein
MKSSIVRSIIAAAALAVAVTSASAQTYKAEIPVGFRAGNTQMLPGAYDITIVRGFSGTQVFKLNDLDHNKSVLLVSPPESDVLKSWKAAGKPVIAFECLDGSCSLSRMWNGKDPTMYKFPTPKVGNGEARASIMVVKLNAAD